MAKSEVIRTGVSGGVENKGANPTGKICSTHDSTIKGLPARDIGKDSIIEVALDENMNIPTRSK